MPETDDKPRVLVSNVMMLQERARFDETLREMGFEPIWAEVAQFLDEAECLSFAGRIDGWLAGDDRISRAVLEAAILGDLQRMRDHGRTR